VGVSYDEWLATLAGRPRFGARDRLGTANFINARARERGAESISTGETVSLARPMRPSGSPRGDGKPGFAVEVFYTDGPIGMGSDHVELDCHGRANTHLDALNHIAIGGQWYCGWAVDDPDGPSVAHLAELQMACSLEIPNHLFSRVLVLADQRMHVVRHDRAAVAGVALGGDDVPEAVGDDLSVFFVEG